MSDTALPAPAAIDAHGPDEHSPHGQHDAHDDGHISAPLGPVDAKAWLAGIVGIGAGLLVAAALLFRPAA